MLPWFSFGVATGAAVPARIRNARSHAANSPQCGARTHLAVNTGSRADAGRQVGWLVDCLALTNSMWLASSGVVSWRFCFAARFDRLWFVVSCWIFGCWFSECAKWSSVVNGESHS